MKITKIETCGNEIKSITAAECKKNDYEIVGRVWVRSDGESIIEWTPEEYIRCDPHSVKIMPVRIGGTTIDAEVHCVEIRRIFAKNKDGITLLTFLQTVDYMKDKDDQHR